MKKDTDKTKSEEFKNFEELARKLLAVPKQELDKARDADQENMDKRTRPPR
jgi:hypothetical protein